MRGVASTVIDISRWPSGCLSTWARRAGIRLGGRIGRVSGRRSTLNGICLLVLFISRLELSCHLNPLSGQIVRCHISGLVVPGELHYLVQGKFGQGMFEDIDPEVVVRNSSEEEVPEKSPFEVGLRQGKGQFVRVS